jgi:hypothetical protein
MRTTMQLSASAASPQRRRVLIAGAGAAVAASGAVAMPRAVGAGSGNAAPGFGAPRSVARPGAGSGGAPDGLAQTWVLSGQVRAGAGALAGATVAAWTDAGTRAAALTDADGRFVLALQAAGFASCGPHALHYRVSHPAHAQAVDVLATGLCEAADRAPVSVLRDDAGVWRAALAVTLA